jgi:hypothetical protein
MISIRLSEEEYVGLCRLSAETSARSLSDLARDAMRAFLKANGHHRTLTGPREPVQVQMDTLSRRIDELREQLALLEKSKKQFPS